MIYLDNAATARYVPGEVQRAFHRAIMHKANAGRGAHRDSAAMALGIYRVRQAIKELVDDPSCEVVFTKNCTEALNLAIRSHPFGHIVTTATEHNSVLRPLHEMAQAGQITLTIVSPADWQQGVRAADVEGAIRPNTRLIVVNHVSNVTGVANDVVGIGQVAAKWGIPYLIDAAQSMGHIPFSMREIACDMVAAPAHKGLYGLQGGGFLAYRRSIRLTPLLWGGTGTDSTLLTQPLGQEGLEAGTQNAAAICALGAAIRWTKDHQTQLSSHLAAYGARLLRALSSCSAVRTYGGDNGIVALSLGDLSSAFVADKLDEMGIASRAGLHCAPLMHKCLGTVKQGLVRLSWGWNNRLGEVQQVLSALETILHA